MKPHETVTLGYYRNIKNGGTYKVLGFMHNATNGHEGEIMVNYKSTVGATFVREIAEFRLKFEPIGKGH